MSIAGIVEKDLSAARAQGAEKMIVTTSRMIVLEVPNPFYLRFGDSNADRMLITRPMPFERCDGKAIGDVFIENVATGGRAVFVMSDTLSIDVSAGAASDLAYGGAPFVSVDDDLGAIDAETTFNANAVLGRNGRAGSIAAPVTNLGAIQFKLSSNGSVFSGWYPLQPGQAYDLDGIDVHTIVVRPKAANDDVVIEVH